MNESPPITPISHTAKPRLSIVVATFNAASTLERCLLSIVEQDFVDWELLISDGSSTDETVAIIEAQGAHVAWWKSEKDSGIYDAWNQALMHARGEYVCFLGADDYWADKGALTRLFSAIGSQRYDLVTSRGRVLDPATGKSTLFGSAWNYRRIGRYMVVCHPGLLHRRTLFETHGLFDTKYRIVGDLDFLLRIPSTAKTLHIEELSVIIDAGGVSRSNVLARLREQRDVLSRCDRYGAFSAYLAWLDKLWRYPIARLLNIPH